MRLDHTHAILEHTRCHSGGDDLVPPISARSIKANVSKWAAHERVGKEMGLQRAVRSRFRHF
jgi:hypothetical protein